MYVWRESSGGPYEELIPSADGLVRNVCVRRIVNRKLRTYIIPISKLIGLIE